MLGHLGQLGLRRLAVFRLALELALQDVERSHQLLLLLGLRLALALLALELAAHLVVLCATWTTGRVT